jgi:hypothetical protein
MGSNTVFVLLLVSVIGLASFDLSRNHGWKELSFKLSQKHLLQFLLWTMPGAGLLAVITVTQSTSPWNILLFLLAAFVPFVLAEIHFPAPAAGGLLLLLSLALTGFDNQHSTANSLLVFSLGLLFYKAIDILYFGRKVQFEDVIPAIIWLSTLAWYQSSVFDVSFVDKAKSVATQKHIVLLALTVSFVVKILSTMYAAPDRLFLKRIALSATGGSVLFLLTNNVLLSPFFALISALYTGGLFTALFCNGAFSEEKKTVSESSQVQRQLQFVILIGILTLIGSRTFGTFSFLVLASTTLLAPAASAAGAVALFWTSRVLLETYVFSYNSNVTGINLMHPYVSASLFAGFFISLLFTISLMRASKGWQDSLFFVGIASVGPILSNYFLHEEPTSGFLSSLLTASVLLICFAPLLNPSAPDPARLNSLMLVPAFSLVTALFSSSLLALGNETPLEARIQNALYITGFLAAITLVAFIITTLRSPHGGDTVVG